MKIRRHRGGLQESVATMQEIPCTLEAVQKYMQETSTYLKFDQAELDSIVVEPHHNQPDDRIGWKQTCIIRYTSTNKKEMWVLGFCDQLLNS